LINALQSSDVKGTEKYAYVEIVDLSYVAVCGRDYCSKHTQ